MGEKLYAGALTCNGLDNPLGIACEVPCLRWKIKGEGRNVIQKQFRLQVSSDIGFGSEYRIADITADSSLQYFYLDKNLKEKTKFYWRIRLIIDCQDASGYSTGWSETACFETAFKDYKSWTAKWIEADEDFYEEADILCRKFWKKNVACPEEDQGLRRNPYLIKTIKATKDISSARIYVTARGLYEIHINGEKIGDYAMAPDFTAYDKMLYYQTYDITNALKPGENMLQVVLGDGWFAGHAQGIPGTNHLYGKRPALLLQGEIYYHSGSSQTFVSDENFSVTTGPLLYTDLFMGEYWDHHQPVKKFKTAVKYYDKSILVPQRGEGVIEIGLLPAISARKLREGEYIVDFGRIIAGRERILFEDETDHEIKIEYSERLDESNGGDLMNLIPDHPFHDQTTFLHTGSQKRFVFEPKFSFQGFRYIKISGVNNPVKKEQCQAVILETGMKDTISFQCSNFLINRLVENAQWSQRGNMISIPTDCPQRERGGFTGDAQIFCTAATWNQNVEIFFRRWLEQCRLEQLERGQIPIVVPYSKAYSDAAANPGWTSAGWGDAIVFMPWDLYQAYGDIHILEENYEAMERWMHYVKVCAEEMMPERFYFDYENRRWQKYLWNAGFHWGDWLLPGYESEEGAEYTKEVTASLFYYRAVCTMELICKELNASDRAAYYAQLKGKIRTAFGEVYITGDGLLDNEFQGAYVLALYFGIVEGCIEKAFASRLNDLVKEADYHLQTGFLSTPYLLDVLCGHGFEDTAVQLFYQDSCPSWMYQVKQGATTIWENWDADAILKNGKTKGTSFNHYAFGCICDFIYRKIAGVSIENAGFKKTRINPEFNQDISSAALTYETPYGLLRVEWKKKEKGMELNITIPHNTVAVIGEAESAIELGSGHYALFL